MDVNFFRKTNRKSVILLLVILVLVIANWAVSFYLHGVYIEKSGFYEDTSNASKNILLKLQKQIRLAKDVLLSVDENERNSNYYQFSKYYTEIQNDFFNFHYAFIDSNIRFKIEELAEKHKQLSRKYLDFLYNSNIPDMKTGFDRGLVENEYEVLSMMDEVASEIDDRVNEEIYNSNMRYVFSVFILLGIQVVFTFLLLATILNNSRKAQNNIVDLSRRLNCYLPPQLIHSIMYENYGSDSEKGALSRKLVTVCFTDLQGFTKISGKTDPEIISKILNEYLIDMSTIVHAWGGMIDKFMGDGIMILFNAFDEDTDFDHAYLCVNMALAMQHRLKILNVKWENEGLDVVLNLRIGINTGQAVLGSFGPDDRKAFTAVGNAVNIASRLENVCPPGEVLVSSDTKKYVEERFVFIETGTKIIKGFSVPHETYIVKEFTE